MQVDRHIFDEFGGRVRLYVSARSSNRNDVDDIVQDTFLRFYSSRHDEEITHPLGYLYRIATNLMIDRSRRRSPLNYAVEIDDVTDDWLSARPRQEDARRLADLQHAYHAALTELSPRCAEVFRLRRHREMTTPDVAAHLSITTRMVQKHMVTAMAHLQDRLRPFLFNDHSVGGGERTGGGFSAPVTCQMTSSSTAQA